MAEDSLGEPGNLPTIRSASSGSLAMNSASEKYREAVGPKITAAILTDQLTRMNAVFGNPKDRTEGQIRIMANEWHRALSAFGAVTVVKAITRTIETWKFGWQGALAEVVEQCRADDTSWRDAFGLVQEPSRGLVDWTGRGERFEQEGRTTVEEIAHRAATVAAMKAESGFGKNSCDGVSVSREDVAPASKSIEVSFQVRNSCAARRARREPVCEENCSRQRCELRENEAKQ